MQASAKATRREQLPWNEWVRRRSRAIGFRSDVALAEAIGCNKQYISRWLAMPSPPVTMRKGFDAAFCRALKIDRHMFFFGYINIAPETAPMVEDGGETPGEDAKLRGEIVASLDKVSADRLRALAGVVREFVASSA